MFAERFLGVDDGGLPGGGVKTTRRRRGGRCVGLEGRGRDRELALVWCGAGWAY